MGLQMGVTTFKAPKVDEEESEVAKRGVVGMAEDLVCLSVRLSVCLVCPASVVRCNERRLVRGSSTSTFSLPARPRNRTTWPIPHTERASPPASEAGRQRRPGTRRVE